MKKIYKSVLSKIFLFTLAALIGLWSAGLFEGYAFQFGLMKTFSRTEVQNLLGKNVRDVCYKPKLRTGKIIGNRNGAFGDVQIKIKWENEEFSWMSYSKSCFEKCVKIEE